MRGPSLSEMLMELRGLTTPCSGPATLHSLLPLSLLRRFSGKLSMESASVVSRVLPLALNFKFSFIFGTFFCCDLKFKCKFFLFGFGVEERGQGNMATLYFFLIVREQCRPCQVNVYIPIPLGY